MAKSTAPQAAARLRFTRFRDAGARAKALDGVLREKHAENCGAAPSRCKCHCTTERRFHVERETSVTAPFHVKRADAVSCIARVASFHVKTGIRGPFVWNAARGSFTVRAD